MQQVYSGGLVESVQGGGDRPRQLLCEARPDPDGEVHEPGGRLQLLHQRGVASPRGRASLPGGKKQMAIQGDFYFAVPGRPRLHGCHPSPLP